MTSEFKLGAQRVVFEEETTGFRCTVLLPEDLTGKKYIRVRDAKLYRALKACGACRRAQDSWRHDDQGENA